MNSRFGAEKLASTKRTFLLKSEIAAPKAATADVFPTPPFKLKTPNVFPMLKKRHIDLNNFPVDSKL